MFTRRTAAVVEPLEGRQLYATVGLDPTFVTHTPAIFKTLHGTANFGAEMPGGKFLAAGVVWDGADVNLTPHNVYMLYNANGSLATSFGHGGYAIQSAARTAKLGIVSGVYAMSDGSALIQFDGGLRRLTAAGDFDGTYGTGGVLNASILSARQRSDGTTLANLIVNGTPQLQTFDRHGNPTGKPVLNSNGLPMPDGRISTFTGKIVSGTYNTYLSIANADGSPVKTFATNGTLALTPIYQAWLAKRRPWYSRLAYVVDMPASFNEGITPTRDGGYVIDAVVYAVRTKPIAPAPASLQTRLRVRVDAKGKLVSINAAADDRAYGRFIPATAGTFGGLWHFGEGEDTSFALQTKVGNLISVVPTSSGSDYLTGMTRPTSSTYSGLGYWTVARVVPSARISGTTFNDQDGDGFFEPGEYPIANRTVYLDANNNGRFDAGEEYTVSDAAGRYAFNDVGTGVYVVRLADMSGYRTTSRPTVFTATAGTHSSFDFGSSPLRA